MFPVLILSPYMLKIFNFFLSLLMNFEFKINFFEVPLFFCDLQVDSEIYVVSFSFFDCQWPQNVIVADLKP